MSSGKSAGISLGARRGVPIFTRARATFPRWRRGTMAFIPALVSTLTASFGARPASTAYLAKQRRPLPLVSASEPSGLNRRMDRSAFFEDRTRSRPSPPTPRWRWQSLRARAGQSLTGWPRQSTRTKSFPDAWSLTNFKSLLYQGKGPLCLAACCFQPVYPGVIQSEPGGLAAGKAVGGVFYPLDRLGEAQLPPQIAYYLPVAHAGDGGEG